MDAGRHPNIELLVDSEVEDVTGFVGNFHVRVRRKARYVDASECNNCGECVAVCPVVVPDEYQQGFSSRKAIYLPFPQAVPSAHALNMNDCLGNQPIACGKCLDVCEKHCIDFDAEGGRLVLTDLDPAVARRYVDELSEPPLLEALDVTAASTKATPRAPSRAVGKCNASGSALTPARRAAIASARFPCRTIEGRAHRSCCRARDGARDAAMSTRGSPACRAPTWQAPGVRRIAARRTVPR